MPRSHNPFSSLISQRSVHSSFDKFDRSAKKTDQSNLKPRAIEPAVSARKHNRHDESRLQKELVEAFRKMVPAHKGLVFAVPNGGSRSKREAAIMKGEGVTAGVADLVILYAMARTCLVEVKLEAAAGRRRRTRQSENQVDFERQVTGLGHQYEVVRSLDGWLGLLARLGLISTR